MTSSDRIGQLSRWLEGTDIALLELSGPGESIRLQRAAGGARGGVAATVEAAAAASTSIAAGGTPAASAADQVCVVRAGCVGVLLWTHPLRTEPLAGVGQQVHAGQVVALLRVGMVLLGVHAPRAGRIRRLAAQHEAQVGWGEPLLEIE